MRNTRNINHAGDDRYTDVFRHLDADFDSSLPEVQAKMMDNIHSMIHGRFHSAGKDPAMAQPFNHLGSFDENFGE